MLAPRYEINASIFSVKHGRFPPHFRCNVDQVPLPFVVSQDGTCTDDKDKDAHVKAPGDALRKRQFTMHVICNAWEGEERDGYTVLTCKGKQKGRRAAIEKYVWNKKIPALFQKTPW